VPFTLSHPAVVVPLRRLGFPLSALIAGSLSPDFVFFLRLMPPPRGHFSHTVEGLFLVCVPGALLALLLFHRVLKWPTLALLPNWLQARLIGPLRASEQATPAPGFLPAAGAVLVGAASHLVWDDFTHGDGHTVQRLPILAGSVLQLPGFELYRILQYGGSIMGAALLLYWSASWLREAPERPIEEPLQRWASVRTAWRVAIAGGSSTFSVLNGVWQYRQTGDLRDLAIGALIGSITGLVLMLFVFSVHWRWKEAASGRQLFHQALESGPIPTAVDEKQLRGPHRPAEVAVVAGRISPDLAKCVEET
jgi:hypothetical protein